MTLVLADRVQQTTTTSGTTTPLALGSVVPTGFLSFVSAIGNSNTCYYCVTDNSGNWEIGIGTVASGSPDTLARTTIIASSAGGTTAATLASGTNTVFATAPAFFLNALAPIASPTFSGTVSAASVSSTATVGFTIQTPIVSSNAVTINWNNGAKAKITLPGSGTCAVTMTAPTTGVTSLQLIITGTASLSFTWTTTVKWAGGTAYSSNTAGGYDVISLLYDGTNYYGTFSQGFA